MKLIILFCVFVVSFSTEVDKSYECLKNVISNLTNSSCPLITPEIEKNVTEYARLFTACTKGHYLIQGCNESEWVHACTRRVANIPNRSSSSSLRGMHDIEPMWEACNKDVVDPDFQCLKEVASTMNNESCPELAEKAKSEELSTKAYASLGFSCLKDHYIRHGCNRDEWTRVCNRYTDKLNVGANGGEEAIDMWRNECIEPYQNEAYHCFEKAVERMHDSLCPEVTYAKSQNETADGIMREQTSCYKRLYINDQCEIAEWKKVCSIFSFTLTNENGSIMRKYCKQ